MSIGDLDRIEEEARKARIQAGFDALRETLHSRHGSSNTAPLEPAHTHCVVCGIELPKGLRRVCSGACYQQAPL